MARGTRALFAALFSFVATLAGVVQAASQGNVTFNGSQRFLFDVDGNHISAYALKIYCL